MEISLGTIGLLVLAYLLYRALRRRPKREASVRVRTDLYEPDDFAADPHYDVPVVSGSAHANTLRRQAATGPIDRVPMLLAVVDDGVEVWAPEGLVGRLDPGRATRWRGRLQAAAERADAPVAVWGRLSGGGPERPYAAHLAWPDDFAGDLPPT